MSESSDARPRCEHCRKVMPPKPKSAPKQARFCKDACRRKARLNRGPAQPKPCAKCGELFKPRGNARKCSTCVPRRNRFAQYGQLSPDEVVALYRPNPCASCVFGKASKDAESGYLCTGDKALQCKPWGPATAHRERLIGGESTCYAS